MNTRTLILYIYKITNLINGKIYIGQHSTLDIEDGYFGSGRVLRLALKKYGKESFTKEVLEFCSNREELNEKEKYYIRYYDSMNTRKGYNISFGGPGGHSQTEETRKKISDKTKGIPKPIGFSQKISRPKGPASEEHKRKNAEAKLGRKWYYNPETNQSKLFLPENAPTAPWTLGRPQESMRGTHTEEATKKWRESNKDKKRSSEFRSKMSNIVKESWQRRKENERDQKKAGDSPNNCDNLCN